MLQGSALQARTLYVHQCTEKKGKEKKMPASAKASKMKSPKTGTIERARKTTDLTSKDGKLIEQLGYMHKIELESLDIIYCICNNMEGRKIKNKIKLSQANNNNNGKRARVNKLSEKRRT